jgi:hypothetical protein
MIKDVITAVEPLDRWGGLIGLDFPAEPRCKRFVLGRYIPIWITSGSRVILQQPLNSKFVTYGMRDSKNL